jgi:imidazole glycerol-phosphate synthase subunit HisH
MLGAKYKNIRIGLIDLKSHNLFSILQATKNIGYNVKVIRNYKEILKKNIIIIPGVGSFKHAMKRLKYLGFDDQLKQFVLNENKCLFGICLGMQLLFSSSEEFGYTKGLNLIEGKVKKFKKNSKFFKIPHIGWNSLNKINHGFIPEIVLKDKYYFTHSFYCSPKDKKVIHTNTSYFRKSFCSSVVKKNIIGTQFHPEKSGKSGLEIIKKLKNIL